MYILAEEHSPDRDPGLVKIGFSNCPISRLETLQTGNPRRLYIMAAFPAHRSVEKFLHQWLSDFHHRNEWFRYDERIFLFSDDVLNYVHDAIDFKGIPKSEILLTTEHVEPIAKTVGKLWPKLYSYPEIVEAEDD